jgi:SAM-dependent methyltransferase
MSSPDERLVSAHYARGVGAADILDSILSALRVSGRDPDQLTWEDLSPVDQFHVGGRAATLRLAALAGLRRGQHVLDVGGGIGGPARALAATIGCRVTVLDLTKTFTQVGTALTARTGLKDLVTFRVGDALEMPLHDTSVDVAWTQHSTMNIGDKERLYAELHRVVRPGGRLAMHEVVAGEGVPPLHFPVPWAADPGISFLRTADDLRATIAAAGFAEAVWADVTGPSIEGMREQLAGAAGAAGAQPPVLALHLLQGERFHDSLRILLRNLEEGRARVVQGVFDRA